MNTIIEILKDTEANRTFITIEDGKMKINKESVALKKGDVFESGDSGNIHMNKGNIIEIKMRDNSSLSGIPMKNIKITQAEEAKPRKKKGCGSCGKKR